MLRTRLIVVQSGGPTAVINCSLVGVIESALERGIKSVIGARFGVEGVINSEFIDLVSESPATLARLQRTPSAALGSSRHQPTDEELDRALATCQSVRASFVVFIGGNDSALTGHRLAMRAAESAAGVQILVVPKTVDNDLPETDHCPGFGSAARFLAHAVRDSGRDTEAMQRTDPVKVIEVQGRNAGWLAAATALAKREDCDAPHVVCTPEEELDLDRLAGRVDNVLGRIGFCVVVASETVRRADGSPLAAASGEPDDFGHPRLAGVGAAVAADLAQKLAVRTRWEKPGSIARELMALVSTVDQKEAYQAGRAAVDALMRGHTDQMVTLYRSDSGPYACGFGLAPLATIAGVERRLPPGFLSNGDEVISDAFRAYAEPLLGDALPEYARLKFARTSLEGARP